MRLLSEVRFIDEKLKKAFYKLEESDNSEKQLFKFINQALTNIEENAFCGTQIPNRLVPKQYVKKYGITNLWKYDLPNAWRLIYSIRGGEVIVVSIVLEWMTHKEYNRRFGYG
ncbi:MAG: type II toxin-antitoxin system RelE/ParE family toxin [Planctomycetes bacterium]|nr:type II toxin-antitoxin system RelE/ParE family toxin [Planctomycetota bacterium]